MCCGQGTVQDGKQQMDDTDGSVAPRAEPAPATTPASLPCYLQELDVAQLVELLRLEMLFDLK